MQVSQFVEHAVHPPLASLKYPDLQVLHFDISGVVLSQASQLATSQVFWHLWVVKFIKYPVTPVFAQAFTSTSVQVPGPKEHPAFLQLSPHFTHAFKVSEGVAEV